MRFFTEGIDRLSHIPHTILYSEPRWSGVPYQSAGQRSSVDGAYPLLPSLMRRFAIAGLAAVQPGLCRSARRWRSAGQRPESRLALVLMGGAG